MAVEAIRLAMDVITVGTTLRQVPGMRKKPFEATNLSIPSEYDHANRPELITIKRKDLEQCIRTTIEETMCDGGMITTLSRDCMEALDQYEVL